MAITKIGTPELFDFSATNTALQLPAGDTASRPTSPSTGEWRYNTELKNVEYYDGAAWFRIDDEALPAPVPVGSENFNVNTYFGTGVTQAIDAKFNEAANFNGSSSFIEVANNGTVFDAAGGLTLSFWVKRNSTALQVLLNKEASTSGNYGWSLRFNPTQGYAFDLSAADNSFLGVQTGANTTIGNWEHIVASYNLSDNKIRIYYNGGSPVVSAAFSGATSSNSTNFFIGKRFNNTFYVDGKIDQIRVFDNGITDAQAEDLYTDETTTTAATLDFPAGAGCVAAYQLDGNGDDISGNYSAISTTDIGYTGLKFEPDLVWIKIINAVDNNFLVDSVRGANKLLQSNNTASEVTTTGGAIASFDTNGFTLQATPPNYGINLSPYKFVAWCFKAGGAATDVTSSSSAVSSALLSANADAGFSIVRYVQNGNSVVLPHGLATPPSIIIVKKTNAPSSWFVYNNFVSGRGRGFLDTTSAFDNSGVPTFTSTNIEFQNQDPFSPDPATAVMYSFANVPGYSSIGSYPGNNLIDGPEIVTGFRPAFVMFKATNADGGNTFWVILDNKRDGTNTKRLYANSDSAEDPAEQVDFLSNSFKIRTNNSDINGNFSYIYLAIAS